MVRYLPAVAVVVSVTIAMMAAFPRLFEFVAALFSLAAARAVSADRLLQVVLRFANALFAPSVVTIAIQSPRGDGPGEEHRNDECCDDCFQSLNHAFASSGELPALPKVPKIAGIEMFFAQKSSPDEKTLLTISIWILWQFRRLWQFLNRIDHTLYNQKLSSCH